MGEVRVRKDDGGGGVKEKGGGKRVEVRLERKSLIRPAAPHLPSSQGGVKQGSSGNRKTQGSHLYVRKTTVMTGQSGGVGGGGGFRLDTNWLQLSGSGSSETTREYEDQRQCRRQGKG